MKEDVEGPQEECKNDPTESLWLQPNCVANLFDYSETF